MSMPNLKTAGQFSDRLRAARLRQGLSQEQLADKLGVSNGAVGNWETGPTIPRPSMLRKIEKLLGVDIATLLHGPANPLAASPRPRPPSGPESPRTSAHYAWMETGTLENILTDLATRLPQAVSTERPALLASLGDVLAELAARENTAPATTQRRRPGLTAAKEPSPLTEAQKIAQAAGEKYDRHKSNRK